MDVGEQVVASISRQLGRPAGIRGRIVGRVLNRRNREPIAAAVEAAGIRTGRVVADVGFDGGVCRIRVVAWSCRAIGHGARIRDLHNDDRRRTETLSSRDPNAETVTDCRADGVPTCSGRFDWRVDQHEYDLLHRFAAFSELHRILAGNGCAVLGIADPDALWAMPFTQYGFQVREFDAIVDELQRAGLHVEERIRAGGVDFPYWLLVARKSGVR